MGRIRVYGDAQGTIVVEGDIDVEFDAQNETTYLHFSDGTVVECDWGDEDLNFGRGSAISLSVLVPGEAAEITESHYDSDDGTRSDVLSIKSPAEWVEFHRWMAPPSIKELLDYWMNLFVVMEHRPKQLWEAYRALHRFDGEGEAAAPVGLDGEWPLWPVSCDGEAEAAVPEEPDGEGPTWPVSCDPNDRSTVEYWESQPRDPEIAAFLDFQEGMHAEERSYQRAIAS